MASTHVPVRRLRSVDARIASATLPGFPVTTRAALAAVEVDSRAVARRLDDGRLWEIWRPVILVGIAPSDVTPDHVLAAALVTVGPHAALDGPSALERRGLWDRHDGAVHVVSGRGHAPIAFRVPSSWRSYQLWRRRPRRITVRFRRSRTWHLAPHDRVDGLPTLQAIDALVSSARLLTPHQLAYVIKCGEYAAEFTLEDVDRVLVRRCGTRGVRALRRAVRLRRAGSAGTKSRSEDRALPPMTHAFGEPHVNVRGIAGIATHEPDLCWPERRWIVEIDGPHHTSDPAQQMADLATDEELRAAGWIVVRIPWREVWDDLPGVLARTSAAFGLPRAGRGATSTAASVPFAVS